MNQNIGTDYIETQRTLSEMNNEISNIAREIEELVKAIDEQKDWQGPDAVKYKEALLDFAQKMANTCGWMENLDNTISAHSAELYNRSIEDANNATRLDN